MAFETGLEDKPAWVGALVGLLVGGGLYFGAYKLQIEPKIQELTRLEAKLSELQTKIQEGRAAKAQLPQFREEVRLLELELDKLLRILPARRNTPELLRRIRTLTEQGDFELEKFNPGSFEEKEFYSEWPILIKLEGTYHNLALFYDKIRQFSRIVNIENLKVVPLRTRRGEVQRHTIDAEFTAKTFVYKETPEIEEPLPAAAGGGG